MTIKDASGRYLQNDGTVDGTYNSIGIAPDVANATSTTWSREITVPTEGAWTAQARARDTGGNSSLDTVDRLWNVSENGQAPRSRSAHRGPWCRRPPRRSSPCSRASR